MKYLFFILLFASCLERRPYISHEPGVVLGKSFRPDSYYSTMDMQQVWTGNGYQWQPVMHTRYDPEQWLVIFKCQHGLIFNIDRKDLYIKLSERDTVKIDYYELVNKKGQVKDFDFIDANKTTASNW